jgi:hypothetical protein
MGLRPQAKARNLTGTYVSQCKVCGQGVYEHDERVWSRKPLGLCHKACVDGGS